LLLTVSITTAQPQGEPVEFETGQAFRYDSASDTAQGESITARWREYLLESARFEGRTRRAEYRFFEGVRLSSERLQAQGAELLLNTRTRRWTLLNGRAELTPAFTENRLLESLHLQGARIDGDETRVHAEACTATTCGLEHPHFHWSARTIDATPGERAVLRDVRLTILGRTVLRLPYLVVPLREGEVSQLPDAGYTEEEGFYLRYALAYLLAQGALGSARFDLMQKRGLGVNLQQNYARGDINLYLLRDLRQRTDSLTGRWQHGQTFGALQTRWNAEYRRNSYLLFSDNTAWSLRTDWTLPSPNGTDHAEPRREPQPHRRVREHQPHAEPARHAPTRTPAEQPVGRVRRVREPVQRQPHGQPPVEPAGEPALRAAARREPATGLRAVRARRRIGRIRRAGTAA
jgi:hypothetical protein